MDVVPLVPLDWAIPVVQGPVVAAAAADAAVRAVDVPAANAAAELAAVTRTAQSPGRDRDLTRCCQGWGKAVSRPKNRSPVGGEIDLEWNSG